MFSMRMKFCSARAVSCSISNSEVALGQLAVRSLSTGSPAGMRRMVSAISSCHRHGFTARHLVLGGLRPGVVADASKGARRTGSRLGSVRWCRPPPSSQTHRRATRHAGERSVVMRLNSDWNCSSIASICSSANSCNAAGSR